MPALVKGMLLEYPNLWVDLSWELFHAQEITAPDGAVLPQWENLIAEFSDRFTVGSDAVGATGVDRYTDLIVPWQNLLVGLKDPTAARRIARENLHGLLPQRRQVPDDVPAQQEES